MQLGDVQIIVHLPIYAQIVLDARNRSVQSSLGAVDVLGLSIQILFLAGFHAQADKKNGQKQYYRFY